MGVFSWLVLGFLAGTIAGIATGNRREGCITRIAVGIVGALLGGSLARAAGIADVSFHRLTFRAVLIATAGAALLLLILQAITGGRGSRRGMGRR